MSSWGTPLVYHLPKGVESGILSTEFCLGFADWEAINHTKHFLFEPLRMAVYGKNTQESCEYRVPKGSVSLALEKHGFSVVTILHVSVKLSKFYDVVPWPPFEDPMVYLHIFPCFKFSLAADFSGQIPDRRTCTIHSCSVPGMIPFVLQPREPNDLEVPSVDSSDKGFLTDSSTLASLLSDEVIEDPSVVPDSNGVPDLNVERYPPIGM